MEPGKKRISTPSNRAATAIASTLDHAAIGQRLTVHEVSAPLAAPEWVRLLEELGFIHGEHVMLMARAMPGGDPLVVRVGQSTFALRRAEAACIRVAAHESVGNTASHLGGQLAAAGVAA